MPADLEQLAVALLGPRPGGWVRQGGNYAIVARIKFGSQAARIPEELRLLAEAAGKIRQPATPEAHLCAAAFYHLRFENIHPLREGNGRVGRHLLAAQLQEALPVPSDQVLRGLQANLAEYKAVFAAWTPDLSYHNLVKLLARICGVTLPIKTFELPAPISALYPTPGSPLRGPPPGHPAGPRAPALAGRPSAPFWRKMR